MVRRYGLEQQKRIRAFGSSFNVVDPVLALEEVSRIVVPGGWVACMEPETHDPLQKYRRGHLFSLPVTPTGHGGKILPFD